jgi:hypothetical protein
MQEMLFCKPHRKRPCGRPKHTLVVPVLLRDITETGCECVDWIQLAQVRAQYRTLVDTVMNHLVP